jgi:OPA family glycerol-3-phosphate transporter-like MFS transporter
MSPAEKLRNPGHIAALFWLCAFVYFTANIGRLNLSAVIGTIVQREGISRNALGLMATLFFFTYGGGQLLCGMIAEYFSPAVLIGMGIFIAGAANLVTAFSKSVIVMQACWMLNGMGQSFLWIPMVRILAERLSEKQCTSSCLFINLTGPAGTFFIYGLSAVLLHLSGWRMVFLSSSILMFLAALLWIVLIPLVFSRAEQYSRPAPSGKDNEKTPSKKHIPMKHLFSISGLGFLIFICCLQGMLKDGLNTWMPAYVADNFVINPSLSAALTMTLPLMSIAGVFLTRRVTEFFRRNEARGLLFLFLAVAAALLMLIVLPKKLYISLLVFGCVTTLMVSINTLLISLMPLHYVYTGRMTTIIGILNTSAYFGSGIAGYGISSIIESFGWNGIRSLLCGTAFLGALICIMIEKKWRAFLHSTYLSPHDPRTGLNG